MTNRYGTLVIIASWIPIIAIVIMVATCSGCFNSYRVHGDPHAGIPSVTATSSPFHTSVDVDVTPVAVLESDCHARAPHDGGTWVWLAASQMCFWQARAGAATLGFTSGGYGSYGGMGYYSGTGFGPSVGVPGVR